MKCSKCGNEMEAGVFTVHGYGVISILLVGLSAYWCKKKGFFKAEDKHEIDSGWGSFTREAYICKKCKIISFDYE